MYREDISNKMWTGRYSLLQRRSWKKIHKSFILERCLEPSSKSSRNCNRSELPIPLLTTMEAHSNDNAVKKQKLVHFRNYRLISLLSATATNCFPMMSKHGLWNFSYSRIGQQQLQDRVAMSVFSCIWKRMWIL